MKKLLIGAIVILFVLADSCNKSKNYSTSGTYNNNPINSSLTWQLHNYKNAPVGRIIDILVLSKEEIYAYNAKEVYYLNGEQWEKIFECKDRIEAVNCDGHNFIYSTETKNGPFWLPHIYHSFLKKNKKTNISLSKPINIPFSHAINQIRLISKNKFALMGIMEFGILDIINLNDDHQLGFSFSHQPLLISAHYSSHYESFGENNYDLLSLLNTLLFFRRSENNYYFEKSIELPFAPNKEAINGGITHAAFCNLNYGCLIHGNKFVIVAYDPFKKDYTYRIYDKINLPDGIALEPELISDIEAVKDSTFWCVTENGMILKNSFDRYTSEKFSWYIVGSIPNESLNIISIIDSLSILTAGNTIWKIFKSDRTMQTKQKGFVRGSFYVDRIDQIGGIYGVGVSDLDNSGIEDVLLVDLEGINRVLFNPRSALLNSVPKNEASERGLEGRYISGNNNVRYYQDLGITLGDIDESGADDCILTNLAGSNLLYLNNGEGYFKDFTESFSFDENMYRSSSVVTGDVNNDGYLDVFSTSELSTNRLHSNQNAVNFNDITLNSGLQSDGSSNCAAFGDINNDGWLDLYVGNWVKENQMYLNNGNGTFKNITEESGLGCGLLKKTNSVFFADMDNDGDLDLFIGNRGSGNKLFLNEGKCIFKEISEISGINNKVFTNGAVFADFDNDGWQDIFTNNLGNVHLYKNLGRDLDGIIRFKEVSKECILSSYGIEFLNGHNTGAATTDLDNDGDIDIIAGQYTGFSSFLENKTNISNSSKNFIKVKIEGSKSNRNGIGTKVKLLKNNNLIATREITGGYGYASVSSKVQHFGIADVNGNYIIEINFPASGVSKRLEVLPGSSITVKEYTGVIEKYHLFSKAIVKYFYSNSFQSTILKLLVVLAALFSSVKIGKLRSKLYDLNLYEKITIPWPPAFHTIFVSIGMLVAISTLINYTQEFFLGSSIWINNKKNVFLEEIVPVLTGITSGIIYLKRYFRNKSRQKYVQSHLEEIYFILRKFRHGEDLLMNLNRISLLIQNYEGKNNTNLFTRIKCTSDEYKQVCLPELTKLAILLGELNGVIQLDKGYSLSKKKHLLVSHSENIIKRLSEFMLIYQSQYTEDYKSLEKIKSKIIVSVHILAKELAELSKIITEKIIIDPYEIFELVQRKFDLNSQGIEVVCNIDKKGFKVVFNIYDMQDIISLIVQNALESLSSINRVKKIIAYNLCAEAEKAIIKIEDNGISLSTEMQQKIFNDGFTTKLLGHGFGLNYVKRIVEKYGGIVTCGNSSLGGTAIIIELKAEL